MIKNYKASYKEVINALSRNPAQFQIDIKHYAYTGMHGHIEKNIFVQTEEKLLTKEIINRIVDFDHPEKKLISIKTNNVRLNIELGTQANLNILEIFIDSPIEFKETSISLLVDHIFEDNWRSMFLVNSISFVQNALIFIFMVFHVHEHKLGWYIFIIQIWTVINRSL